MTREGENWEQAKGTQSSSGRCSSGSSTSSASAFVRRGVKPPGGHSSADVVAPGVWVECKAQKLTNPRGALRQAEGGARTEGGGPSRSARTTASRRT